MTTTWKVAKEAETLISVLKQCNGRAVSACAKLMELLDGTKQASEERVTVPPMDAAFLLENSLLEKLNELNLLIDRLCAAFGEDNG